MPTIAIPTHLTYVLNVDRFEPFYFTDVSGLGLQTEVIENVRLGQDGKRIIEKIPGRHAYPELVLTHRVNANPMLWAWRAQVEANDNHHSFRHNAVLVAVDFNQEVIKTWRLFNAWPRRLTIEMNGAAAPPIEILTLVYDGLS